MAVRPYTALSRYTAAAANLIPSLRARVRLSSFIDHVTSGLNT
jgi:hypothetical protein